MNDELADVEIVYKPIEDSISTSNPKAKTTCEKKITNVYIAEQKILFVLVKAGDFLGKIASTYEALTADDIADINKLPNPNQLAIGQEIIIPSKVHIVQSGDTLSKIAKMSEYAPVEWKEIAKANQLSKPYNIQVGQKLVIPLARSKHAKLCKEIKYVPKGDVSVGDVVHIVTEVTGFKNGESVNNTIKEDKNIVTQAEETLAVVENDKEKKEIISIVKLDEKDPTKGIAVSEPLEVKPKLDMLIYEVKQGDVLGKIVKLYEGVTVEDIAIKNNLDAKNTIYVGQKLIIPTKKMNDVTSTQEVKDELNEEPTKSTEIVPVASSPSLPKDEDVEGEVVNLTVEPKIVDVYFGTPIKSSKVKPTTQIETYTFVNTNTITKDNQKKIITKYIIPRTTKGDRKATYADALKALPLGTYKAESTIDVVLSEPIYTYKKIKSTSLFSTVYLVAEVKDFKKNDKVTFSIQDKNKKITNGDLSFLDESNEVTSVKQSLEIINKKQFIVKKITLSPESQDDKEKWKKSLETVRKTDFILKVVADASVGCKENKKKSKELKVLGVCLNTWSNSTNTKIEKLHPKIRCSVYDFINIVEEELSIKLKVTQGLRTYAEQNALYAKGRTTKGTPVTNAKGGYSYHNFGLAIDVVESKDGKINWNTEWNKIAKIGIRLGFEWGGNWKSILDRPHFQMTFGYHHSKLREKIKNNDMEDGYVKI